MDLTQPRSDQARNQIIQAAYHLFVRQGYHGTSMRQIASEAGVALGGIYNHFPAKDALFVEVLHANHPLMELLPEFDRIQAGSAEGFVRQAARQFVEKMAERREFINLMFIELVEFNGIHLQTLLKDFLPGVLAMAEHLEHTSTELRPMPAVVRVRAFWGFFFSYVLTDLAIKDWQTAPSEFQGLDHFVDIYLHGILAGGSKP